MKRVVLLALIAGACTSADERARQAAAFQQARDSLSAAPVVTTLQPPASRLVYDQPADLSYDSLLVNRPELARASDRQKGIVK